MDFYEIFSFIKIAAQIIIAFGLVILFHELGHFIMAKKHGVEVPEFAFGMGPELFGFDFRGTRYKLCLFPIGGYIKMVGEDDDGEDAEAAGVPRTANFRHKTPLQKISIIFAGPFMNLILAVLLFGSVYMIWGIPREMPDTGGNLSNSAVAAFVDPRKPAGKAGMKKDDIIVSVNGSAVTDPRNAETLLMNSTEKPARVIARREGKEVTLKIAPNVKLEKRGKIGAGLDNPVAVSQGEYTKGLPVGFVTEGMPADKAGIKKGDIILALDGDPVESRQGMIKYIESKLGSNVRIDVLRDDERVEFKMIPEKHRWNDSGVILMNPSPRLVADVKEGSIAAQAGFRSGDVILDFGGAQFMGDKYSLAASQMAFLVYRGGEVISLAASGAAGNDIGVVLESVSQRVNPVSAVWLGAKQSAVSVVMILDGIVGLIRMKVSADDVAGPVGIIQYAGVFARQGFSDLVHFFGVISVCLGVINLFPFPALDGSRIVFHTWEAIIRRPLDSRREGLIHTVGFAILISLILVVTYRDIRIIIGL
ncbi:MAG TPA: RIP metalloprotease RseP [bacterium]|nr:RIP metalloprotease RseP [bacterium]